MRLRQSVFDGIFATYSLLIAAGFTLHLLAGYGILEWDAEIAEKNMFAIGFGSLTAAVVLALACAFLSRRGFVTLGEVLFAHRPPEPGALFWKIHLGLTLLLTFAVSVVVTEFSFSELTDPQGFAGAIRLYRGLIHANLALLPAAIVQIINTVFIAFLATSLAIPIAFAVSFLAAKNLMRTPVAFVIYAVLRTILNITRSVEPLIWAVIFTVWVGVGPFAGMLALFLHSIASLAKQFSEIIEDVSEGPIEGILATGANAIQTMWFGIVPQVMLQFIAYSIFRWDTNVRMATVIGLVGGGGIGTLLLKYQGQAMWPEVGCIILVIAVVVWAMDSASAYLREALK